MNGENQAEIEQPYSNYSADPKANLATQVRLNVVVAIIGRVFTASIEAGNVCDPIKTD